MDEPAPTYYHGLWCPWAEVVCYDCHGDKVREHVIPYDEYAALRAPRDPPKDSDFEGDTKCNRCDKRIVVRADVAACSNLQVRCVEHGVAAELDQTGGMCVAVRVPLDVLRGDELHLLITDGDEPDCSTWLVGFYDDEDGGPRSWEEHDENGLLELFERIGVRRVP